MPDPQPTPDDYGAAAMGSIARLRGIVETLREAEGHGAARYEHEMIQRAVLLSDAIERLRAETREAQRLYYAGEITRASWR